MRQAVIWTNADPVHWRIYAALGGEELSNIAFFYAHAWPFGSQSRVLGEQGM